MIKAVIFDWGGVHTIGRVSQTFCQVIAKEESLPLKNVLKAFEKNNKSYLLGKISGKEFFSLFAKDLGINRLPKELIHIHSTSVPINKEMFSLVKKVKKKVKVAILSDNYHELSRYLVKTYKLKSVFDVLVFSNDVGMKKPQRKIYQLVLDRLSLRGEECIFVDDRQRNVSGARKLGIHAFLFTSTDRFKKDLTKWGIEG